MTVVMSYYSILNQPFAIIQLGFVVLITGVLLNFVIHDMIINFRLIYSTKTWITSSLDIFNFLWGKQKTEYKRSLGYFQIYSSWFFVLRHLKTSKVHCNTFAREGSVYMLGLYSELKVVSTGTTPYTTRLVWPARKVKCGKGQRAIVDLKEYKGTIIS